MVMSKSEPILDRGHSWLVLLAVFGLFGLFASSITMHSLFIPEFIDYFRISKAEAAVPGSLSGGIAGLVGVAAGPLTKRFGTRVIVVTGSLLTGLSMCASGFAGNMSVLNIFLGVLPGIGVGLSYVAGTLGLFHYFKKRRALAMGIGGAGFSAGSFSAPLMSNLLISNYGWRGALFITGALHLNGLAFGAILRPQEHLLVKEPETSASSSGWRELVKKIFDFTVLKNVKFIIFLIVESIVMSSHDVPFIFLPSRAIYLGFDRTRGAALVTIMSLCSGCLRPIYGLIGDYVRRKVTFILSMSIILTGLLHALSYFLKEYLHMALYAGMAGLANAGYVALENAVLGDIVPTGQLAHAFGFVSFLMGVTGLIIPPVAGLIIDVTGDFSLPFVVFGIVQVVGGFLCLTIYLFQRREGFLQKEEPRETDIPDPEV